MRILHTSDWHLGQHFMGLTRQAEHSQLIDWLLAQVAQHHVDAVLVAGDIFDTGSPPSYARELYHQLIARLHAAGCALLLLGGNHDSVSVLGESLPLLQHLHTTVIASTHSNAAQHVVTLPLRATPGSTDRTPGCIVCALPFIRARDVQQSQAGQSAQDKQQALQDAIQHTYAQVYAAAQAQQAEIARTTGRQLPIIATGHLTTLGASSSESVREIYVGTLTGFPTDAFPPADYIALGHIHQPMKVGGHAHIRYCGSPIALAFDEDPRSKQMLLVELDGSHPPTVTPLPIPMFQPMASVRGSLDALPALLHTAAQAGTPAQPVWLEVTVAQDDYLNDLAARIEQMTQSLPVRVLRLRRQRENAVAQLAGSAGESLHELSPHEVFQLRLAQEALSDAHTAALQGRYHAVLSQLHHPDQEAV